MSDSGINDKDVLVFDRSLELQNNKIAIYFFDRESTVKSMKFEEDCLMSHARKPELCLNKNY